MMLNFFQSLDMVACSFYSMNHCCRNWLIDSRAIAKKIKNASWSSDNDTSCCEAKLECPNCRHTIDNSDVSWNLTY